MPNYQQYLTQRARRMAEHQRENDFLNSIPVEVKQAILAREDTGAKVLKRGAGAKPLKPEAVLLILEEYGVDVTETMFDEIYEIYQ